MEIPISFFHIPPDGYSYEIQEFSARADRIVLHCNRQFDYNLGASTSTIWGFYSSKKRKFYAPINSKTIGKEVNIRDTNPYSAMQIKLQGLEKFFV